MRRASVLFYQMGIKEYSSFVVLGKVVFHWWQQKHRRCSFFPVGKSFYFPPNL